MLAHLTGTLRFDLRDGDSEEHWFVSVKKGDVQVSRGDGHADVSFGLDAERFAAMTEGRVNAMAAALRGEVQIAGDLSLAMAFSRVFPGPPNAVGPDTPAHRVGVVR
jgi:putative sterol carrier protein